MIPKIIHLCWLSGDPFPDSIKLCLDSWKIHLPDYEVWLWDTKRFDVNSTIWTKEAFERKKYAFAADYIRLYALYNYGGIYLDSDVVVYKSFNDLLQFPYFIGQSYTGAFEAAVIGAEKGTKWLADILERYKDRHFIKNDGTLDMEELPKIFSRVLNAKYRFYRLHQLEPYFLFPEVFYLFDKDFFNSRNSIKPRRTFKSYCAHNYLGGWSTKQSRPSLKTRIQRFIPDWLLNLYFTFSHNTFKKKQLRKYEPRFMNDE
mgnify:CR=1 FL=1